MIISGIVCEYNPFHNGHRYLLDEAKKSGTTHTVCIMSGNFVQRGDIAVTDKYVRAEEAVKNGADLVIELPLPYALGTAETFARGSVGLLDRLGCIDRLYFGTENGIEEIEQFIEETLTEDFNDKLKTNLDKGLSYPDAVSLSSDTDILRGSNNILAVEYMMQLRSIESDIEPCSVIRKGAGHNSQKADGEFMSASTLREKIKNGESVDGFLPDGGIFTEIADINRLTLPVLSALRRMNTDEIGKIADVNEGLEFRIEKAVKKASSLDELIELIKTRRYTNAKIRRIILSAYLGVTREMQNYIPNYINVLALNKKGAEIVAKIKENSQIKVVTGMADRKHLCTKDKELFDFTVMCDDLYSLSFPVIREGGFDLKRKFKIIE